MLGLVGSEGMKDGMGNSCGLSPARPRREPNRSGRPRRSTLRWVFVLHPRRDRLIACVNGQEILPIGGHEMCPLVVSRSAQ